MFSSGLAEIVLIVKDVQGQIRRGFSLLLKMTSLRLRDDVNYLRIKIRCG
jgi:hypothetical protein